MCSMSHSSHSCSFSWTRSSTCLQDCFPCYFIPQFMLRVKTKFFQIHRKQPISFRGKTCHYGWRNMPFSCLPLRGSFFGAAGYIDSLYGSENYYEFKSVISINKIRSLTALQSLVVVSFFRSMIINLLGWGGHNWYLPSSERDNWMTRHLPPDTHHYRHRTAAQHHQFAINWYRFDYSNNKSWRPV